MMVTRHEIIVFLIPVRFFEKQMAYMLISTLHKVKASCFGAMTEY